MPRPDAAAGSAKPSNARFNKYISELEKERGSGKTCMTAPDFLDTNILVYAYDSSDPKKQQQAQDLIRRALAGESVISTQVLAELATTLLHKLSPPAQCEDVKAILNAMGSIKLVLPDGD